MADTLKENLKKLTVKKLRNIISNSNIKNYSKLKKLELINLILSNKTRIAGSGTNPDFLKPKTKIKVGRKITPKSNPGRYRLTSDNIIQDKRRFS